METEMRLTVKHLNINERMSEETLCFSGDLMVNGVFAAVVRNRGTGGCNEYDWVNARFRDKVEAWAKAQPVEFDCEHLDQIVNDLVYPQSAIYQ